MEARSAVVVVLDRVGAGYLGPYGNTWLDTPAWNRLASESWLMEFVQADSPDLLTVYRSLWKGCHALCGAESEPSLTLPRQLAEWGIESVLVTDEDRLIASSLVEGFSRVISVPTPLITEAAVDVNETQLARVFSTALDELQSLRQPVLLWIHARAMEGAWDAPAEFRERFLEEGDPPPPPFVTPPDKLCGRNDDPDELWGLVHAYSGQIALTDLCLGAFLEHLQELDAFPAPLVLVTSPRGYPLGEHGRIGGSHVALFEELLHVPALLRFPDGTAALRRDFSLLQPPDFQATLTDWFAADRPRPITWGQSLDVRTFRGLESQADRAYSVWGEERVLRTAAWFLRQCGDDLPTLYAKPDDRREMNEIASRARREVEALLDVGHEFVAAAQRNERQALQELSAQTRAHRQ